MKGRGRLSPHETVHLSMESLMRCWATAVSLPPVSTGGVHVSVVQRLAWGIGEWWGHSHLGIHAPCIGCEQPTLGSCNPCIGCGLPSVGEDPETGCIAKGNNYKRVPARRVLTTTCPFSQVSFRGLPDFWGQCLGQQHIRTC